MSLVPRCPTCDGLEVWQGHKRSMDSIRCHCGDDEPNALKGEGILDLEVKELPDGGFRVAA
jgi:hypothetical protein